MVKVLYTKESVLDKKQLNEYLAKLASDNVIKSTSDMETYPIKRVKENCEYISLVYTLLNEHVKIGIPIHPAGEWILDNFYIIEKSAKTIEKELTKESYKKLPGLVNSGFARIFVLANEIVSNTDGKINEEDLKEYLEAYQTQKNLNMQEIWKIGIFLQISIIEKIRYICEKIFVSQMQKYKVDNIVQRLIENKNKRQIKISVEGKYPFIEYMSYKLKKYGKIAIPYLSAFEEQVNKMGMTVSEVINREHFDIAVKTLSMKNCITSIKAISRIDLVEIFRDINIVEKILNRDPAGVYSNMDYNTKNYYRATILEISKKTKISEIFIAEEILRMCTENLNKTEQLSKNEEIIQEKKSHVGYYLIDDGKSELLSRLLNKNVHIITNRAKSIIYILSIYFFTILITAILFIPLKFIAILLFIPIQNTVTQIIQYILSKCVKTKIIPKMDYQKGIPEKSTTMCVIPAILRNKNDVKEIMKKMEVYYLANKSKNIFFTLLGDCTSSKTQNEKQDAEIIEEGRNATNKLNKKYGDIFFFTYRKREWSNSERCYMGWERKRGLLNQFNEYLETGNSKFEVNTCEELEKVKENKILPKIKYVITLDSDTNLTLETAFQLVGAMSHILNTPQIDKIKNIVIKGHAIIQPRIGIDIVSGRQSIFSRLFAGNGGTDLYTNAVSDVYQDNFNEGIYTGKGIYDLDVFYQVLNDRIPENRVLSHDLLEGSYLRCGLASDIVLMDGYPSNYSSYKARKHRWIRGDIQIIPWLKSEINLLSKYKIIDNIVRNTNEIFLTTVLIIAILSNTNCMGNLLTPIILLAIPMLIKLFENLLNKRKGTIKHRLFASNFSKWSHSIYMFLIQLAILPDIAILEINAIAKALYRMNISHNYMLEWTTSEETEIKVKDTMIEYLKTMIFQIIIGVIFILNPLGILWILTPILMWALSKKQNIKIRLINEDIKYLNNIGKETWKYFKDNMINFMPADNYQEDRKNKVAKRTSPTNIGLAMISAVSAYDLKYEDLEHTIDLIKNMINTIEELPKWNGHLYNWYDIEKKVPIFPLDISSVDSGNFIGYLYTTKQFLIEQKDKIRIENDIDLCISQIDKIINETDFSKLYNYEAGLFSIGFSCQENKLYDSYYDLLASEARQTSLIAIAKKDVPTKHWNNLGRTLTRLREHKGLVSWGGTAFEYLMPNINIPTYPSTLIDESCKLLILSEKEYAQKLGIPWGMSEAAYSLKDFYGNYQYKTFGIPWLGLKRGLADETVVSPYSVAMALPMSPRDSINNLKQLEKECLIGKYGFYDAIDYRPKKQIVKTYMAHHQGMILTSINNTINDNILQKRFMENPEMKGVKILLEENMPEDVIVTKEKKDKVEKIKYKGYEEYSPRTKGINVISTNDFSTITTDDGKGYSQLENIILNNGTKIYIKDINNGEILDINNNHDSVEFTPYSSKIKHENGRIKTVINTTIAPDCQTEIKEIQIKNKGLQDITLEVTAYTEPILSSIEQYEAHPTFDKMFLRYKYESNKIIITRKPRINNEKIVYLTTSLYSKENNFEFEINKEKIMKRENEKIPAGIKNSYPFSNRIETAINPIIAMRQIIKIKPNETSKVYLINSAALNEKQSISNADEYMNIQNLTRVFELSKAQTEAEIRYMGLKEKDIAIYQEMIECLIYPKKKEINFDLNVSDEKLWKYGISGDFPILVVRLKEINDYYVARDAFKAFEYFMSKNIKIELIILTNVDIIDNIRDDRMDKYLNKRAGIFVLNNLKREEKRIIEARANLIIDAHNGSLEVQMNEFEKNNLREKIKYQDEEYTTNDEISNEDNYQFINKYIKNMKFENGYGEFNQDGSEYWIKESRKNRIPTAWSNILANDKFGTVTTDNIGGYTWYINSRTNRVTKFTNDSYMDPATEIYWLEDITENAEDDSKEYDGRGKNKRWSLNVENLPNNNDYYICYGFGYAKYFYVYSNIEQELTVYVPTQDSVKINVLKLKNDNPFKKKIKLKYETSLILGDKESEFINEEYKENLNMILIVNNKNPKYYAYITSNEKINKNKEIEIELAAYEEKEIAIVLGCERTEMECIDTGAKYSNNYKIEEEKTRKYWNEKVKKVEAFTPMQSFNFMQNGWLVYQTIVSRLTAKTGFYQSSGGNGFRDQLQDALGMKYVDSDILRKQILIHASHQFYEGDVEHWWHEDTHLGIRTRYSDDLLWLPYAVIEYIEFTGDYSILNENAKYIKAEELEKNEYDRVRNYIESEEEGTIFEHCYKAITRAMNFGKHGLPLIKSGDWNDGMNKIGKEGKGESVWLGFFLYDILIRFIDLINYEENFMKTNEISKEVSIVLNDKNEVNNSEENRIEASNIEDINFIDYKKAKEEFLNRANNLKKNLNTECWDGRWYVRAFDDNNNAIGSINNEECKIDSICQSWSVISNAGDNDKKFIAMNSLENYLIDDKNKVAKLLTPPLEKNDLGYISSYARGMRENGGQYTHAAIWATIANCILGLNEGSIKIYKIINPIEHTKTKEELLKYKVEPYVIEADIYGEDNLAGRGGWTWYTGSSSWLYEAQVRYILGIKIQKGIMKVNPCVPNNWNEFEVKLRWKNAIYNLKYKKTGQYSVKMENKEYKNIELKDNGSFIININF